MKNSNRDLLLKAPEILVIDDFLKESKTSVLTILFTDIQGFTAYTDEFGDEKTAQMRSTHDNIMKNEIEGSGGGKIIKYIGDSVMAIFSEPSKAIEVSSKIQRIFLQMYEAHQFPLKVRMGLHLGQVTVENKIGPDIFGGHVNKASRVEALADGGQILATTSVIESARTQIKNETYRVHSHGNIKVKGLKEEFEIFEILFMKSQLPHKPTQMKKKFFSYQKVVGLLLTIFILFLFNKFFFHPSLYIENPPYGNLVLDEKNVIHLKDIDKNYKEIEEEISRGKHILYYKVSSQNRFYAPIEVENFQKYIKPKFESYYLPSKEHYLYFDKTDQHSKEFADYIPFKVLNLDHSVETYNVGFLTNVKILNPRERAIQIDYDFIDQAGEHKKGQFKKSYPDLKSTKAELIDLGTFNTVHYKIEISVGKKFVKVKNKIEYEDNL